MGALTFSYPPETGLAIGEDGGKYFSPFVRLEVHFNNPEELKDHVDHSGFINRQCPLSGSRVE